MKRGHRGLLLAAVTIALIAGCATLQNRWEETKLTDTIAAYEDFLREYPEGGWADQARARKNDLYEERDWKAAEANDTIAGYQDFLKNYPNGRHKNDASIRLETLAAKMREIQAAGKPEMLAAEKLLKRYQPGVFMSEALFTAEKISFEKAATDNTISAYEDFLQRYPAGKLADDVRRRVERLYFEKARTEDTLPAYDRYLNRYPDGVFSGAARFRQEQLKPVIPEAAWGTILYPKRNTNIRAKRSTASPRRGQLKSGQTVKADFLQDGWYAVFPVTQKERNEKMALGYVYAPLLIDKSGPKASGPSAPEIKPTADAPPKTMEAEGRPVEVKNIIFKVAADGKELLFIEFDRFYTPAISGIEGKAPRIILDIKNASAIRNDLAVIQTAGQFIRRIRSRVDPQTGTARIVLDMVPEKDCFVNQSFYIKENMYTLEISEKKESRLP